MRKGQSFRRALLALALVAAAVAAQARSSWKIDPSQTHVLFYFDHALVYLGATSLRKAAMVESSRIFEVSESAAGCKSGSLICCRHAPLVERLFSSHNCSRHNHSRC
jgi:hypothetical protein